LGFNQGYQHYNFAAPKALVGQAKDTMINQAILRICVF
jgi:hypothetical protein